MSTSTLRVMTFVVAILALVASPVHAARKQDSAPHNLSVVECEQSRVAGRQSLHAFAREAAGLARPRSRLTR